MPKNKHRKSRLTKSGMTLIEVSVAMAIMTMLCGGLFAMGISVRRSSEHLRIETEARSFGKEAVEEIIAAGKSNLSKPDFSYINPSTMVLPHAAKLMRSVSVIWHDKDGAVVEAMDDEGYAEVHVKVRYQSPVGKIMIADSFSTIIN